MVQLLASSLFPVLLILSATSDVLTRRIPNRLVLVIALLFFPLALLAGMRWELIALHAGTALGLFILGYMLFSLQLLGGGDAKLLAAASLWMGPAGLFPFLTMTVLAGGLLSLVVMAWAVVRLEAELRGSLLHRWTGWLKPKVPYGYAIAAGALLAFQESWWGDLPPG
jgi:prepilin peptidase CpaA